MAVLENLMVAVQEWLTVDSSRLMQGYLQSGPSVQVRWCLQYNQVYFYVVRAIDDGSSLVQCVHRWHNRRLVRYRNKVDIPPRTHFNLPRSWDPISSCHVIRCMFKRIWFIRFDSIFSVYFYNFHKIVVVFNEMLNLKNFTKLQCVRFNHFFAVWDLFTAWGWLPAFSLFVGFFTLWARLLPSQQRPLLDEIYA